jgi:hypothetical protein
MKTLFLLVSFLFGIGGPAEGPGDCNTDPACARQTLSSKKWPLAGTKGFNLGKAEKLYFHFTSDSLHVVKSELLPGGKTGKSTTIFKTRYEIVKGDFNQVYVRIYNVPGHLSQVSDKEGGKKESYVDFQFLFNNKKLVLRCNSGKKDGETIENIFE